MPQEPSRWLSVQEVAAHLGVSRETVYAWIKNKSMPAHRVGRHWKFKRDEVDDWVRADGAADHEDDEKLPLTLLS